MDGYEVTLYLVEGTREDGHVQLEEEFFLEDDARAFAVRMVSEDVLVSAVIYEATMKARHPEAIGTVPEGESL